MVFKKDLTPLSKKGTITKHSGKGASEAPLPSRGAVNSLTKGDPMQRTFNNYAKQTPGPETAVATPDIMSMGNGIG